MMQLLKAILAITLAFVGLYVIPILTKLYECMIQTKECTDMNL